MIDPQTVLILGAGASVPYGYPSGEKLSQNIYHELKDPTHQYGRELIKHGFSESDILEFRNSFFYSGKSSIDAFLEHRPEFIDIGKLVIARSLIPHENIDKLFESNQGRWYKYFFNNNLNNSIDDIDKNKLGVITFNYDRSFEQFLFTALKNSSGENNSKCASKIKKIPFIHVHGNLDDLEWQSSHGRPYDSTLCEGDFLDKSAKSIKIIHEDIDEAESFKEAHKIIDKADNIYFLGFGYNKTNVERLNIILDDKSIFGTHFGLQTAETYAAEKLFDNKINFDARDSDVFLYLRQSFYMD